MCGGLSFRSLQFLPPVMDLLNISATEILTHAPALLPGLAGGSSVSSTGPEGTKSTKTLVALYMQLPRLDLFLHYYAGSSIEVLVLCGSTLSFAYLVYFLSKTPNLECICFYFGTFQSSNFVTRANRYPSREHTPVGRWSLSTISASHR